MRSLSFTTRVAPLRVTREKPAQQQGPSTAQNKHIAVLGFPGGPVIKNLPCNSGDTGSISGPGRSHMPWRN